MKELILLGFGIVALIAVWHFVIRRTALDHFRDQLFDLRESVRGHYIERDFSLEDKTYRELRLMINSQIRFLEDATFTSLILWQVEMANNKDLRDYRTEHFEKRFATDNKELAVYIDNVRLQAYRYTSGYILNSSLGLTAVTWLLLPIVLFCVLAHASFKLSRQVFCDSLLAVLQKAVSREIVESASSLQPA